jgi:hypothetical protein
MARIGLVGGLDRNERQYTELAATAGCTVEHHTGCMAGTGTSTLGALVERSDVVIVITDVNSHAAMWRARRLCRTLGRECVLVRRLGTSRFKSLLAELGTKHAA